jgi:hypothetical protein
VLAQHQPRRGRERRSSREVAVKPANARWRSRRCAVASRSPPVVWPTPACTRPTRPHSSARGRPARGRRCWESPPRSARHLRDRTGSSVTTVPASSPPALPCPTSLRARTTRRPRRRRLPRLSRRAPSVSVSQTHPGWAHRHRPIASPGPRAPRRLCATAAHARHRYRGVLAPHAGLRAAVVAIGRAPAETPSLTKPDPAPLASGSLDEPPRTASSARIRWGASGGPCSSPVSMRSCRSYAPPVAGP